MKKKRKTICGFVVGMSGGLDWTSEINISRHSIETFIYELIVKISFNRYLYCFNLSLLVGQSFIFNRGYDDVATFYVYNYSQIGYYFIFF